MPASKIAIRAYQPEDAAAFRSLNEEWIERYFRLEDKDRKNLENPSKPSCPRRTHSHCLRGRNPRRMLRVAADVGFGIRGG